MAEEKKDLAGKAEEIKKAVSQKVEEAKEKVAEVVEDAKEAVEETVEEVAEAIEEVVAEADVKVEEAKETVAEAVEEAKEAVAEAKEVVAEKVEEVKAEAEVVVEKAKKAVKKATKVVVEEVTEALEEVKEEAPVEAVTSTEPVDYTKVEPLADFDWSAIGKTDDVYPEDEFNKLSKEYESTLTSIADHEVVDGRIVALTKKEAVIDINYKSEGIISVSEFRYNPDVKVEDVIKVYVENLEDKNGQLVISHKKARMLSAWDDVNAALENGTVIQGFVKCRTKGGLIVDVFGIEAFLPGSQIDVKPIRDYDIYVGKLMEFKVVKINNEFH